MIPFVSDVLLPKLRMFRNDTGGAFMILAAIVILSVLGITALVIDGGRAMLERERMQHAADIAALAGTASYQANLTAMKNTIQARQAANNPMTQQEIEQAYHNAYNQAIATATRYYNANAGTILSEIRSVTFAQTPPSASAGAGALPGIAAHLEGDVKTQFARVLN